MANANYKNAESAREKLKKAATEEELNEMLKELSRELTAQEDAAKPPSVAEMFPEDPGYSFKAYNPATDEQIAAEAESEFRPLAESAKNELKVETEGEKSEVQTQREQARAESEEEKAQIDDELKQESARIEDDTVSQGIARSSVRTGMQERANNEAQAAKDESERKLALTEAGLDAQIETLDRDLAAALAAEDAEAASKIAERVAELAAERQNELNKVTEYNNKVKQQIEDYNATRRKLLHQEWTDNLEQEREEYEFERKYGYVGDKQENYAQRLDLALEFYSQFDAETAISMIERNGYLRSYLGRYYTDLITPFYNERYGG